MKKSRINDVAERAVAYFSSGYNCSQSVLLAMTEHWNIKSDIIPKIATSFGSGISRSDSLCGALTGGIMAIGVKYGTNKPSSDERKKAYDIAYGFSKDFEQRCGGVRCTDLLGYNLSKPNEKDKAINVNASGKKCPDYLRHTVCALLQLEK